VVDVSRAVLMGILAEMHIWLSEIEAEELYHELLAYFGLIGQPKSARLSNPRGKTHITGGK
jgi:hypothetical protein